MGRGKKYAIYLLAANKKWAKIAKCFADTALRDIQDLVTKGILIKGEGGGRSTSYLLRQTRLPGARSGFSLRPEGAA